MPHILVSELQQKLYRRMGVSSTISNKEKPPVSQVCLGRARQTSRKELRKQQRAIQKRKRCSKQYEHGGRKQWTPVEPQTPDQNLANSDSTSFPSSGDSAQDPDSEESGSELAVKDETEASHPVGELGIEPQRRTDGGETPKALLKRLAQDDAEIETFERKLGIKKGRRSLPQAFVNDGLDELLGEMATDGDTTDQIKETERKAAYDSWLSSKRRRHSAIREVPSERDLNNKFVGSDCKSSQDDSVHPPDTKLHNRGPIRKKDISSNRVKREGDGTLAEIDDQTCEGFDDPETSAAPQSPPKSRENPYVAPMRGTKFATYVPPSRRNQGEKEQEARSATQLQKRVQGVVNRLSDGNLISLVHSIEAIYQSNARGKVTEVLADAILAQIRKPETLTDQFFVLIGGFSAAIYKIKGSSFGSYLVRQLVKEFSEQYTHASVCAGGNFGIRKEPSNLLTLLIQLYVFEVLGCSIVFDYLESLLDELSELNVELLLRVCRMAGKLLRRDDPQALKHISNVLNAAIAKVGYSNISVRTKFMVETIQDLKNSKAKAQGMDSVIVCEHVLRMKKRLGELKTQYRRLEGLTPMGIRLKDIEDVGRHGKWWLVGASVPEYRVAAERTKLVFDPAKDTPKETTIDEDMDFVLPDFSEKAKGQGLSTPSQIAIFTAIMSALDCEHGYRQFIDLRLRRDEQLEITRVLVQCVGSELHYNEYYALVGCQACSNGRIRFSFQDRLWGMFRGLGESLFGTEGEEEETMEGERLKNDRRLRNVAQFYASLVADGCLGISVLKPLDLPKINPWCSVFVKWFILSLLRGCQGKKSQTGDKIESIFGAAREIPTLAAGLHWFLRKRIRNSAIVGQRERKSLQDVIDKVQIAVQSATSGHILLE